MMRSSVMTVMLALMGIAGAPLTWAQSEPAQIEQSKATYSDAELKSFAAAAVDVHRINSNYLPKLADANPDEQRQIEKHVDFVPANHLRQRRITHADRLVPLPRQFAQPHRRLISRDDARVARQLKLFAIVILQ